MVVAQRCLEEIVGRGVHFYPHLGAAHIDVVCILNKRAGAQVIFVQAFASAFYDGYISRRQDSLNTDAAFRLKMVAYDELLRLCDADGAVCQYDFIGTGIYHGRIGHEGVFPRQHFYGQHGEDGLQIAFTSGNDSFVVQQGKGKAAGGSRLVYQAEAAEGNGAQSLFLYNPLDGSIQPHGFYHVFGACLSAGKRFSCQSGACFAHLVVRYLSVVFINAVQ